MKQLSDANYIWQQHNWHNFFWDERVLLPLLSAVRLKQGKLIQQVQTLLDDDRIQAEAVIVAEETLKTAQIEGERYDPQSVRSSVYRHLGLDYSGLPRADRHIDGLVDVLFDATLHFTKPLTKQRLFGWHAALFPTGYSGLYKIETGTFRTDEKGPMQVVSGPAGKETVHYIAPEAQKLPEEMAIFFQWWKESNGTIDGLLRAGIAHFYFVTLHPFDDGNGRIARALTDMALAQDDKLAKRYYSLSREIVKQRKQYYAILEQSQKGDSNITDWLAWFITCFSGALESSEKLLATIFFKTTFWRNHAAVAINSRQRKVLNKLLDTGKDNFIGGLTTRKYMSMTKVSRATAIREINDLVKKSLIVQSEGKGRNVSYRIA